MSHAVTSSASQASVDAPAQAADDGLLIRMCEAGWVPDSLLRRGIRRLCAQRLIEECAKDPAQMQARFRKFLAEWRTGPIAIATHAANDQHYEVPAAFFEQVLGRYLKYSCALFEPGTTSLDTAEDAMLALTCERAQLMDGQRILELGCGWGALSLYMARKFPRSSVVAVSNSASQKEWIMARAKKDHLTNLEIVTMDINDFDPQDRFDRVVSVEMFEHVRNHAEMFRRIAKWLLPKGLVFSHVFCHREVAYPFESRGPSDWMARHFFSGGIMPSFDLFLHHNEDLRVVDRWWVSGQHYAQTSEAWLVNLDRDHVTAGKALTEGQPGLSPSVAVQRWRMFFLAVAELFNYDSGRQWGVGHYLFAPTQNVVSSK